MYYVLLIIINYAHREIVVCTEIAFEQITANKDLITRGFGMCINIYVEAAKLQQNIYKS